MARYPGLRPRPLGSPGRHRRRRRRRSPALPTRLGVAGGRPRRRCATRSPRRRRPRRLHRHEHAAARPRAGPRRCARRHHERAGLHRAEQARQCPRARRAGPPALGLELAGYSRVQYNGSISTPGSARCSATSARPSASTARSTSPSRRWRLPQQRQRRPSSRRSRPCSASWSRPPGPRILPPIDKAARRTGRARVRPGLRRLPRRPRARDANGLLPVTLVPLDQIGTDPRAARNFMTRPAETGLLEGRPIAVFGGPPFGPRAGAATIVGHVSTAVAAQVPRERLQAGLGAYRTAIAAAPAGSTPTRPCRSPASGPARPICTTARSPTSELLTPSADPRRPLHGRRAGLRPGASSVIPPTRRPPASCSTRAARQLQRRPRIRHDPADADKADLIEYLKGL